MDNLSNMLIPFARDFALKAHVSRITTTVSGLKRPQAVHLQEVADLVWVSDGTDYEIAAAWLHDSVEDTQAKPEDILKNFGETVAKHVAGLTDLDRIVNLPLAERKARQAERVKSESESVRRVKLADQISNVRSLALDPTSSMTPQECKIYIEGAKMIADACGGISPLLDRLFSEAYEQGRARYRSV